VLIFRPCIRSCGSLRSVIRHEGASRHNDFRVEKRTSGEPRVSFPEASAAVVSLGPLGTRPCVLAQLLRRRSSTSPPLGLVSAAGPCGDGRSRSRTQKGHGCCVVAPAVLPPNQGSGSHPPGETPSPWPAACARGRSHRFPCPRGRRPPGAPWAGRGQRPATLSRR
jgi:hypothetical protein